MIQEAIQEYSDLLGGEGHSMKDLVIGFLVILLFPAWFPLWLLWAVGATTRDIYKGTAR